MKAPLQHQTRFSKRPRLATASTLSFHGCVNEITLSSLHLWEPSRGFFQRKLTTNEKKMFSARTTEETNILSKSLSKLISRLWQSLIIRAGEEPFEI
jgi:hypothetical protein